MKQISKIILCASTMLLLASCGGSEKYNQCEEIFRQQRTALKIDVWCECGQLESKYYLIGSQNGWNSTRDFLAVFMTEMAKKDGCNTFAEWYNLNPKEEKKLDKEFDDYKKLFDKKIRKSCGDPVVKAYKKAYNDFYTAIKNCANCKDYHIISEKIKDTTQWGSFIDAAAAYRINTTKVLSKKQFKEIKKIEDNYNSQIAPLAHKYDEEYKVAKAEEERIKAEEERIKAEEERIKAEKEARIEAERKVKEEKSRIEAEKREKLAKINGSIANRRYTVKDPVDASCYSFLGDEFDELFVMLKLAGFHAIKLSLCVVFLDDINCDIYMFYDVNALDCENRGDFINHIAFVEKANKNAKENPIKTKYVIENNIIEIYGLGKWITDDNMKTIKNKDSGLRMIGF